MERNLLDAMNVARNILLDSKVVTGGGSTELAMSAYLQKRSKSIQDISQYPYRAVATALEIIPRTLLENCGGNAIKLLTAVRAKHAAAVVNVDKIERCTWGIDGNVGEIVDMSKLKVYEPYTVKVQTIKTAIEAACMLLRIDDIVSGATKQGGAGGAGGQPAHPEDQDDETFGDARDG